ncbi:MAG: hypothetical protein WC586_03495 [Methanoregula sp.]
MSSVQHNESPNLPDRSLVNTWVLASNFRQYLPALRQKCPGIPEDAGAAVGYIYIDHDCGISLKIEALLKDDPPGQEPALLLLEDIASIRFRYGSVQALDPSPLAPERVRLLGLPPAPAWVGLYENPDLRVIRELEWLDPFRARGFFDDVMATLPALPGDVPEYIWVRLSRYIPETDRFRGTLLNEPFRDRGIHRGDLVEITVERKPAGISLGVIPARVSPASGGAP